MRTTADAPDSVPYRKDLRIGHTLVACSRNSNHARRAREPQRPLDFPGTSRDLFLTGSMISRGLDNANRILNTAGSTRHSAPFNEPIHRRLQRRN